MVKLSGIRYLSTAVKSIRNVGIIAHIDAGKTTTTERMLFDAGKISYVGEVDKGTTVTDYLEEERKRGITITSATANMKWNNHSINLIDTPGHVDFTLEVERAISVLDSAVTILDGVKGVEAQTQTVWNQAASHRMSNIFFVNKLDRKTANLSKSLNSIKQRLPRANPVLIQVPTYSNTSQQFNGLIDVINLKIYNWDVDNLSETHFLTEYTTEQISDSDPRFPHVIQTRLQLIEEIANRKEGMLQEEFLKSHNPAIMIPAELIENSLKSAVKSSLLSPVLIGSAKYNIGIMNLLDKMVAYLPDPTERTISSSSSSSSYLRHFTSLIHHKDHMTGLAFKLIHDDIHGPLTFVRLFSGSIKSKLKLKNLTRSTTETVSKIMQMTGNQFSVLDSASNGDIVVLSGLKSTFTGDVLVDYEMPLDSDDLEQEYVGDDNYNNRLIQIPKPVIYASLDAYSVSETKKLASVLDMLVKEDPSLTYHRDPETNQLIIGGMGRLHLEVTVNRIRNEFNLPNTHMGRVRIIYKESIFDPSFEPNHSQASINHQFEYAHDKNTFKIFMELRPNFNKQKYLIKGNVIFENSLDFNWKSLIGTKYLKSIHSFLDDALDRTGPLLRYPLIGVDLVLHKLTLNDEIININKSSKENNSLIKLINTAILEGLKDAVKQFNNQVYLLEPFMKMNIFINHTGDRETMEYLSTIKSDLMNKHRANHVELIVDNDDEFSSTANQMIAYVPLVEAMDYSEVIRQLTSGHASVHMEYSHYDKMNEEEKEKILDKKLYRNI